MTSVGVFSHHTYSFLTISPLPVASNNHLKFSKSLLPAYLTSDVTLIANPRWIQRCTGNLLDTTLILLTWNIQKKMTDLLSSLPVVT